MSERLDTSVTHAGKDESAHGVEAFRPAFIAGWIGGQHSTLKHRCPF